MCLGDCSEQVPLLYAPGNTSLYAYGHAHASPHNKVGQ